MFPTFSITKFNFVFRFINKKKKCSSFFFFFYLHIWFLNNLNRHCQRLQWLFRFYFLQVPLFFLIFYHWLSLSSYLLWLSSIHNLRITYPWVDVIRDSKVFDDCLLPATDLKISNKRLCAWTGYLRKDIGKASFYLFWLVSKKFLFFKKKK